VDNNASPRRVGGDDRARRRGAVLALPWYSAEYNEIESFWSKAKQFVRRARVQTQQALRRS